MIKDVEVLPKDVTDDYLEFLNSEERYKIDYSKAPESIREWLKIELEMDGKRGLYEKSSFWYTGKNTARSEDGYEYVSRGIDKVSLITPEGDEVAVSCEFWNEGTDNIMCYYIHNGIKWKNSGKKLTLEEVGTVVSKLYDAALAYESYARFDLGSDYLLE